MNKALLLLASTLTPTHPGAGRSPGLVDLPVARDPLGYPYIPGSEVKGALKSLLARKLECLDNKGDKIDCGKRGRGGFNCRILCCLLGAEEGGEGASSISITSMKLLVAPAPSPDLGVVYIATPASLSQAAAFMEAAGRKQDATTLSQAARASQVAAAASFSVSAGYVWVGASRIEAQGPNSEVQNAAKVLQGLAANLNPFYGSLPISERLLVVPESAGRLLLEKSLLRLTRVRLDRATKTVSRRALWTEEYLPAAALLAGLIIETGFTSKYCDKLLGVNDLRGVLRSAGLLDGDSFYLTIGGKESVGSGLIKIKIVIK